MLTLSTPIPTSLRGQIRARVKAHPNWKAFLDGKGILSASAKNADLIAFALQHPQLAAQIEQVLRTYESAAPVTAGGDKESASTLMLAKRVEALLTAYAARRAGKLRVRVKAVSQAL